MASLRHVLWIGGASATGKTTVATRLARKHGLRWYSADAHTWAHKDRALAAGHEGVERWEAMSPAERNDAAASDPAGFLRLNLDLERGPMIVDDLRRLPEAPLVVAEGATILPEVLSEGHAVSERAVWLLPTRELHRARHEEQGLGRLVAYRWLVAEEVERQAAETGARVVHVDGSLGLDETVAMLEELFADALAEGLRAETLEERQALLRYANDAAVAQARGYLARPWSSGDEATFARRFLCECGDPACTEVVEAAVADYRPGLTAHG